MASERVVQAQKVLVNLLGFEDVLACMLANRGLGGLTPPGQKITNVNLLKLIRDTTNQLFDVMDRFYDYKLDRLNIELGSYTIIIAPVSRGLGLVVVVPLVANVGLLDIEIENARNHIKSIFTNISKMSEERENL